MTPNSPIYIFSLRIHISCAFSDDECSEEEDNGGEDVDFSNDVISATRSCPTFLVSGELSFVSSQSLIHLEN